MGTGERYSIRQALADEEDALSFVCLKTGDSGDDGSHLFPDDPGCLARIYTTPYLRQCPECAFVLCDAELAAEGLEGYPWDLGHPERGVVGYCLGTVNSSDFYDRYITEALPPLRNQFPRPTAPVEEWTNSQHIHNEYHNDICFPEELGGTATAPFVPTWVTEAFPAHLHIDILAHVQRGGWGTKMITAQLQRLTELGAIGVHLIQSPRNYRAYKFYKTLGFVEIGRGDGDLILGRPLAPAHPLYPNPAPVLSAARCFGVVEGFYGRPWSAGQRQEMISMMDGQGVKANKEKVSVLQLEKGREFAGLDSYMYSPKDDRKHRAAWRELYTPAELQELANLASSCMDHGVRMVYGLGPGLDLDPESHSDDAAMRAKLLQLVSIGVTSFMIAFDDVEAGEPVGPYSSAAEAQAAVANRCCIAMYAAAFSLQQQSNTETPAPMFMFCPTEYCGRIAQPGTVGSDYLAALGRELLGFIDVCWTGEEIISPTISLADVIAVSNAIGMGHGTRARRIVLWDNYHANDYDQGRRIFLGPYSGRDAALLSSPVLGGILSNPNVQYECNFIPLATLGLFVAHADTYDPAVAAEVAVRRWATRFGEPMSVEDVALLVDLCYLPYQHGSRAVDLLHELDQLHTLADRLALDPTPAGTAAVIALASKMSDKGQTIARLFERLTEIRQRELCYSIYPYLWDLKEEMDVLGRYVEWMCRQSGTPQEHEHDVYADDDQPETIYPKFEMIYRGGMLSELQRRVPLARTTHEAGRMAPGTVAHFRRLPAPRL